mgnify:CR=1 FL=1
MKKIVYVDMDNVLVDFPSGIAKLDDQSRHKYADEFDEAPGILSLMDPMEGAIEAFNTISRRYYPYILSTAPWGNPSAWSDKLIWVKEHLGESAHKRLILSHNKNLNRGDFLITNSTVREKHSTFCLFVNLWDCD